MAIQSSIYTVDGTTNKFGSSKHIASKSHMAVWVQLVSDASFVQLGTSDFELINNFAVIIATPDETVWSQLEVRVADTPNELLENPSDTAIVASIASEVIAVANISDEVQALVTEPLHSSILSAEANADRTDANVILTDADVASTNADVVSTNADVVLTNADVVLTNADVASTNADVVLTNADVASTNADVVLTNADVASTNADVVTTQLKVWEADAEQQTARNYADTVHNTFVNLVTSDGDGTFTSTPTTDYSSFHWSVESANSSLGQASNISFLPAGTDLVSTNLQGSTVELDGRLTTAESKLGTIEAGATNDQTKADIDALGITATNLSGQTATITEINTITDGSTARGTTTLQDTDGFGHNDNGVMRQTRVSKIYDYVKSKLTGAVSTILTANLTVNRVLTSNSSGKVVVSAITSTELNYLNGVTGDLQSQLNTASPAAIVRFAENGTIEYQFGDIVSVVRNGTGSYTLTTSLSNRAYAFSGSSTGTNAQSVRVVGFKNDNVNTFEIRVSTPGSATLVTALRTHVIIYG